MAKRITLKSIIRDAERSIANVDQLFADTAHWNRLHPDETIDPDPDGEMVKVRRYAEAMIKECRRPRAVGEPIVVNAPLPDSVKNVIEQPSTRR